MQPLHKHIETFRSSVRERNVSGHSCLCPERLPSRSKRSSLFEAEQLISLNGTSGQHSKLYQILLQVELLPKPR